MSEELSSRFCKKCKCIMPLTDGKCDYCTKQQAIDETIKIESDFINELIDANYAVLLAFDVADGNLSVKDYMEKLRNYTKGNERQ